MACINVTTNVNGVPYLATTGVNVGTDSVNLPLGFRNLQPVGFFTVRIANPIPDGTTTTLPVTLTLNGTTRPLTLLGGAPATVANVGNGSGVLLVFNDRYNSVLQLMNTAPEATATTQQTNG